MCVAPCASAPAGDGGGASDGRRQPMPSPQHDGGQPRRTAAVDLSESSSPSKKSEAGRTAASSPAFNDGVSCDGGECVDAVGDKCVKCCAQLQSRQLDAWRRSMSRFGVDLRRLLVHIEKSETGIKHSFSAYTGYKQPKYGEEILKLAL